MSVDRQWTLWVRMWRAITWEHAYGPWWKEVQANGW